MLPFRAFIDRVGVDLETVGFELKQVQDQRTAVVTLVLVRQLSPPAHPSRRTERVLRRVHPS